MLRASSATGQVKAMAGMIGARGVRWWGWRVRALLIAALALAMLSSCGNSARVNYRMTVEVETPEGPRTGSSVWSFRKWEATVPLAMKYGSQLQGEAVAVDLPNGQSLFALLRDATGSDIGFLLQSQFGDIASPEQRADQVGHVRMIAARTGQSRTLTCRKMTKFTHEVAVDPAYDCPMLVTFRNIDDPTSVELVDPGNLAASFGEGVTLKRITVQITDDPVTTGIEKRLAEGFFAKWANANRESQSQFGIEEHFRSLNGQLSRNDFISE